MFGILIKKYVIIIMFIIVAVMSENKYINFTCFVFDVNILFPVLISSRLGKAWPCAGYTTSRLHVWNCFYNKQFGITPTTIAFFHGEPI